MLPPHMSLSLYFTPAAVNRHAHSRVPHKNVRWHCGKAPYHIKVSGRARDVADLDQIDRQNHGAGTSMHSASSTTPQTATGASAMIK